MIIRKAVKQDLPQLQVMYEAIIAHMYAQQICIWDAVYPCICFPEDIKQERMYVLQKDARILAAFALCEHNKGEQHVDWHLSGQKALYLDRLGVHVDACWQSSDTGSNALCKGTAGRCFTAVCGGQQYTGHPAV